jgi:HK97 family phage portal protein
MGKLRDFFLGPKVEQRSMAWWSKDWEAPFGPTAGMPVNSKSLLGLSAAWSAVGLLADSISTLPAIAFVEQGDERIPFNDPPRWLNNPGNGLTRIDLLNQAMVSLLIRGEAFFLVARNGLEVDRLAIADPITVSIDERGYRLGGEEITPGYDVFHVRGLMLPGDNRGAGVVTYARESISSALATQKFGEAFFGNGAWVGATVEVPGALSEDGQKAIRAYMNETHRGPARAHQIGVLTEGAKLSRELTFSPEDSQFLGTRAFQVADIARFFRVPPDMIGGPSGDAHSQYSTLETKSANFVKFSCLPWIIRIEQALTNIWHSEGAPPEGVIKLKLDGLLRGSTKERYDAYKVALDAQFLTINEVRALEDLPPLPEPQGPPNAN